MKTLVNGKVVSIEPQIDFAEDNDGVAIVRNEDGMKIDEVRVYGWNTEEPYVSTPLYFVQLPELSVEQRFVLIKQFETWYGDTDLKPSYWALEFELIVRMLCYDEGALVINPKFLKIADDMYQAIKDIVFPSKEKEDDRNLVEHPDELYRGMVLEQFRRKTVACYNGKPVLYESVPEVSVEEALDSLFDKKSMQLNGLTAEELETEARAYVEDVFQNTGLTVKEVVFVGSRSRALNRSDSDCDFLVEYEGDMKEDGVFNILNHEGKQIYGVQLDFNPFRVEESGSLEKHLLEAEEYLDKKRNTYFRVYWHMQDNSEESYIAFCRAYDELDARKFAGSILNLHRVHIDDIVPAEKNMITRQSMVLNCYDVLHELEKNAVF